MLTGPRPDSPLVSSPPGFSGLNKVLSPAFYEKDTLTGLPTGRVFDEQGNDLSVVTVTTDATGGLDISAGSPMLMGDLTSGEWFPVGSVFRLLMTGTGTVTLDSKDALGAITTSVYTVTLTGATNQIGFPYAGDAAVQIRATLTGTATAKVI